MARPRRPVPELPEVEVVRRGLTTHVVDRRISSVAVYSDRAVRRHVGGAADFQAVVVGHRVTAVRRRGKYLWWALDDGDAILAHLGMSGQFRIAGRVAGVGAERHPHLRIRFSFDDGGPDVDFLDQRTFGGMAFAAGGAELPDPIAHIAPDPLEAAFSMPAAVATIRRKHTEIKRALLDQTVVSGIGNIYADEALWRAKVHYARPTASMTRPVVTAVLDAATEVMTQALQRRRDVLRLALRQRQRRIGVLRPVAERLRPGRSAVPAVRHTDPPGRVHEPLVVLLPALPAPATAVPVTLSR